MPPLGTELDGYVLRMIQEAYTAGKIRKTKDCMADMARDGLLEADVETLITGATSLEKAMPSTSGRASSPNNTHYVIYGTSTKGVDVYCKVCSNYQPQTNEFIEWKLTSFENK